MLLSFLGYEVYVYKTSQIMILTDSDGHFLKALERIESLYDSALPIIVRIV